MADYARELAVRFAAWRQGGSWDEVTRHDWENIVLPIPGPVNLETVGEDERQLFPRIRPGKAQVRLEAVRNEKQLKPRDRPAYRVYKSSMRSFECGPATFRFENVLGWGGLGLALRYVELDDVAEIVRSVVVKRALDPDDDDDMKEEEEKMRWFVGARHIVQLLDTKQPESGTDTEDGESSSVKPGTSKRPAAKARGGRVRRRRLNNPDTPYMIVMEYLENGDLGEIIYRVRERETRIPNKVLWSFFYCLIQACQDMAQPPVDRRENKDDDNEVEIVHFDIDPLNVFIDKTDWTSDDHEVAPRIKLGDLGLMTMFYWSNPYSYDQLQTYRRIGKRDFFAPEQFTEEWDTVSPDTAHMDHGIAGNYGNHTNVWAVALTMECLITLCYPLWPRRATTEQDDNDLSYLTYGAHLLEEQWDETDVRLRRLLCECMAHDPDLRPTVQQLVDAVPGLARDTPDDGPDGLVWNHDAVRAWCEWILHEPAEGEVLQPFDI
ncbi:kinase-like domain-containing protein [Xylariomycetidae sp. FL2044]|nr:kinase-like domain-containing protein [Xylariomycetidae sp. FL2044]